MVGLLLISSSLPVKTCICNSSCISVRLLLIIPRQLTHTPFGFSGIFLQKLHAELAIKVKILAGYLRIGPIY